MNSPVYGAEREFGYAAVAGCGCVYEIRRISQSVFFSPHSVIRNALHQLIKTYMSLSGSRYLYVISDCRDHATDFDPLLPVQ